MIDALLHSTEESVLSYLQRSPDSQALLLPRKGNLGEPSLGRKRISTKSLMMVAQAGPPPRPCGFSPQTGCQHPRVGLGARTTCVTEIEETAATPGRGSSPQDE